MISILVGVFQRRLIYFPTRELESLPSDAGLTYEDVEFQTEDSVSLFGWHVPRDEAAATVLFLHGNAGNISHRIHTIQVLNDLGYAVFIFDYRGYGKSAGAPSEKGLSRDATAAWNYLTQDRRVPADRIILIGRSLGGAVAIDLATRVTPAALVVESTFTNLADVGKLHYPLLPVGLLLRDRFDSLARIEQVRCPKLFLHGVDDSLIPIDMNRSLYERASHPKRFIETPGDHNESGFTYSPPFARQMDEFLREALSVSKARPP